MEVGAADAVPGKLLYARQAEGVETREEARRLEILQANIAARVHDALDMTRT